MFRFALIAVLAVSTASLAQEDGGAEPSSRRCQSERDVLALLKESHPEALNMDMVQNYQRLLDACLQQWALQDQAEAERLRQASEETASKRAVAMEDEAWARAHYKDPPFMRRLNSAIVCLSRSRRKEALAAIAEEHKYGRIGGVVDKQKLYEQQQMIKAADSDERNSSVELRRLKAKTLPCAEQAVAAMTTCIRSRAEDDDPIEECSSGPGAEAVRFLDWVDQHNGRR